MFRAQGHRAVPRGGPATSRRKHRGRLLLLYDEFGALKCETCFQCAAGVPHRVHRHGRRRHPQPLPRPLGTGRAVRRAARGVGAAPLRPAGARRTFGLASPSTSRRWTVLAEEDYDPQRRWCTILEGTQEAYGTCRSPRSSTSLTRPAPGTASSTASPAAIQHLRFEPPTTHVVGGLPLRRVRGAREPAGSWPRWSEHSARTSAASARTARSASRQSTARATAIRTLRVDGRRRRSREHDAASRDRIAAHLRAPRAAGQACLMAILTRRPAGRRSCSRAPAPYDPRRRALAAAERAGAWATWRRAAPSHEPRARSSAIVAESGLRGRGGAGYPTGDKWRDRARRSDADKATSSPTASRPTPARSSTGRSWSATRTRWSRAWRWPPTRSARTQAFIAVKAATPPPSRRLRAAIRSAEEAGLPRPGRARRRLRPAPRGPRAPGRLRARRGDRPAARARGQATRSPTSGRPTRPSAGLWDKPTVVNNVETLAAVPWIVANGGAAYAELGMTGNAGTTLVQLGGARRAGRRRGGADGHSAARTCCAAWPAACRARQLKALLVGGPSGGFLPAEALDTPLDPRRPARGRRRSWAPGTILALDKTDLHRRPGHADDALHGRRGVRQDHPLPHRHAPAGRDRRAASSPAAPGPTDPQLMADLCCRHPRRRAVRPESTATNPLLTGMRYFARRSSRTTSCAAIVPRRRLPPTAAVTAGALRRRTSSSPA